MIDARRVTVQIVVAALAVSVFTLTTVPAFAASSEALFPAFSGAPAWYASARPAPYSDTTTLAVPRSDSENANWNERISYYLPSGANPKLDGIRTADIQVSNFESYALLGGSDSLADPESVIFDVADAFPAMTAGLGTSMIKGITIPIDPNSPDADLAVPVVRFLGHGLVEFRRPGFPLLCSSSDPTGFTVQTAMLAENGFKYAVKFNVIFGDRSSLRKQVCAGIGKKVTAVLGESDSSLEPTPVASQIAVAGESTKAEVKKDLQSAVNEVKPMPPDYATLSAMVGWSLLILAILAVVVFLYKKIRRPTDYYNDGRPINAEGDGSDAAESTHGAPQSARAKAIRKSGYGR